LPSGEFWKEPFLTLLIYSTNTP